MNTIPHVAMDPALQLEVEQFLYAEAELLDARGFREWLDLLTEDVRYWMPTRTNRSIREYALEVAGPGEMAHYDDDLGSLTTRVRRIESNQAWSEDPPSRTRRFVTNVRIKPDGSELAVRSSLLVYQHRLEREVNVFAAERQDVLRRTHDGLRIASRKVLLDQTVVLANNISVFF
ncbi:aromatic-ring-hydroxylating dioxygenase subunit beta [Microtetraspora glauca]|uniref:Aromatic-ring-hydroxylating dioxygenase subunit beta n=1 Tax=Microtetraspora glauca TaxID=1996 RepID=A0ABV3GU33_MICGL